PAAAKLYLTLLNLADKRNPSARFVRASLPTLVQHAALSRRTCIRALADLKAAALITALPRTYHQPSTYRLPKFSPPATPPKSTVSNSAPPPAKVPSLAPQRPATAPPTPKRRSATPPHDPVNAMVSLLAPLLNAPTGAKNATPLTLAELPSQIDHLLAQIAATNAQIDSRIAALSHLHASPTPNAGTAP